MFVTTHPGRFKCISQKLKKLQILKRFKNFLIFLYVTICEGEVHPELQILDRCVECKIPVIKRMTPNMPGLVPKP